VLKLTPASFSACPPAREDRLRQAIADVDRHLEGNRAALDQGGDAAASPAGWAAGTETWTRRCGWRNRSSRNAVRADPLSGELMNPDLLVELAVDLVVSYVTGNDIVLGRRRWAARDVALMLEALDIYLLRCSNPDGREYVMTVEWDWRKNRRVDPELSCIGVDLNRNLDILWAVTEGQTSCNPCSNNYVGSSAFSEPESRNVKHLLDSHRVVTFADVHSYSELVLYPWSHAPTQTTDISQRFTSLPSGTCLPIADPSYQEYMPARDRQRFQAVSARIVEAIADARGRRYSPQPGFELYPTTGTHRDHGYSRHVSDADADKVYGFGHRDRPLGGQLERFLPTCRSGADQTGSRVRAARAHQREHLCDRADRLARARER
jgi:hypothetical protein